MCLAFVPIGAFAAAPPTLAVSVPTITVKEHAAYDASTPAGIAEIASITDIITVTLTAGDYDATAMVRFMPINEPTLQFWAFDGANWHDINVAGWGPGGGFPIMDATTPIRVTGTTAGSYDIDIELYDMADLTNPIATILGNVTVVAPSNDASIIGIEVAGVAATADTLTDYSVTVPFGTTVLASSIDVTATDTNADVVVAVENPVGSNVWDIVVTAEDGTTTETYTVTVTVAAAPPSGGGGGGGAIAPTVTVDAGANGKVTVDKKNPAKDATVVVTVTPDAGYRLADMTITDSKGNTITYRDNGDGTYSFAYPGGDVKVVASFELDTPAVLPLPFVDVTSGDWFADAVKYAYEKDLMNGTATNQFSPYLEVNRGMIVTVLWRLENEPTATQGNSFADVAASDYYYKAVAWAAEKGIVTGYSDTTYAPNAPVTREQTAAILYRYAEWKGLNVSTGTSIAGYADAANVSDYAKPAMEWANAKGLIQGVGQNQLLPGGDTNRAQFATIMERLIENVL